MFSARVQSSCTRWKSLFVDIGVPVLATVSMALRTAAFSSVSGVRILNVPSQVTTET